MTARYFVILGNGRTGSTWLQSSLHRIPGIKCRREIKWRSPGRQPHPAHILIDRTSSVKRAIHDALRLAGDETGDDILGSKLILDPYTYTGPDVFAGMSQAIEPEVRLILLKRRYLDTWLSWKTRGVFHSFNEKALDGLTDKDFAAAARKHLGLEPQTKQLALYQPGNDIDQDAGDVKPYAIVNAVDDMLTLFANDLGLLMITRNRGGCVVDYTEIKERLGEVVRFIGSQAPAAEIRSVAEEPLTLKLPDLHDQVRSVELLDSVSDALDRVFWRAAAGDVSPEAVWHWYPDDCSGIRVSGLADILQSLDIAVNMDNGGVIWKPLKPIEREVCSP